MDDESGIEAHERRQREKERHKQRKTEKLKIKTQELDKTRGAELQKEKEEIEPSIIAQKGYHISEQSIATTIYYGTKNRDMGIACQIIELADIEDELAQAAIMRLWNLSVALSKVQSPHPNIVRVLDVFKTSRRIFIITKYVKNGSIKDYVEKFGQVKSLSISQKWTFQLTKALSYLHSNGVAHRNVNAEHTLLDEKHEVVLTGFSSSGHTGSQNTGMPDTALTETLPSVGVSAFQAPEIGQRYNPVGVDIWAIGVFLFYILHAKYPFGCRDMYILKTHQKSEEWLKRLNEEYKKNADLKDFLSRIFKITPQERMTIDDILDHNWLANFSSEPRNNNNELLGIMRNMES